MSEASRFKRIEALFHAAQRLAPQERAAFLDRECGDDTRLRDEVESLLAADQGNTTGVEKKLAESFGKVPALLAAGDLVGAYQVVELIGEGGMGEVYRALQLEPLHREVALKVVKAGMDTRQVLRRFENERQALALMSHPGIAHVFDAGATDTGRLYFAMELVVGQPITQFCDAQRLPVRSRLELFQRVCEAVQHAHQKGVIHRDLKPSNVLVEQHDGRARPKIIDFGIAKVVASDHEQETLTTRVGQFVGTPEFMSPEQADAEAAIDTRTDVYSLGLLLYELLTGTHPFDVDRLRRLKPPDVYTYLRDTVPERPSLRASRSDQAAAARGCDPAALRHSLGGDLDWIVGKALEKEPDRRYASASELAADVGRHLNNEPVLAGSPSRTYLARKFIRRHRWPVATACAIVLILLAAVAGVSAALVRAQKAEADALHQASLANEVSQFLEGIFAAEDPYRTEAGERTIRAIVSDAAKRLEGGSIEDPELFARFSAALASLMVNQGLGEESLELTERAIDRLRESGAMETPFYLDLLFQRSRAESMLGRYEDARQTTGELVSLAPHILDPGSAQLGVYLKQRGDAEALPGGRHEQQLHWHREAMAILQSAPDASPEDLGSVIHALARSTTDAAECTDLGNQELRIWHEHLGPDHPRVAEARQALGLCARLSGDAAEAERHFRDAVDIQRRVLGPDHPVTFATTYLHLDALFTLGRFETARALVEDSLASARRSQNRSATANLLNMAFAYLPGTGDFASARRHLEQSVDTFLELYEGESEWSLMARHTLADGYGDQGRLQESRDRYLYVLQQREALGLPDNFFQALLLENLALVERRMGLFSEAEHHIDRALDLYPSVGWDPRYHARAWVSKATLLVADGREAEAETAYATATALYEQCQGPRTFLDVRYDAAYRAMRGEREAARALALELYRMGVHPDYLSHEPELAALFGETGLRRLAGEVDH